MTLVEDCEKKGGSLVNRMYGFVGENTALAKAVVLGILFGLFHFLYTRFIAVNLSNSFFLAIVFLLAAYACFLLVISMFFSAFFPLVKDYTIFFPALVFVVFVVNDVLALLSSTLFSYSIPLLFSIRSLTDVTRSAPIIIWGIVSMGTTLILTKDRMTNDQVHLQGSVQIT